jgi:hypothetical protein
MSEQIQEQIPSRESQNQSPEIRRLFSDISRLAKETKQKLEKDGISMTDRQLQSLVYPSVMKVLQNPEIKRNLSIIKTIERHIVDFYDRIGRMDVEMVEQYMKQKWIFEDASYDQGASMRYMESSQKRWKMLQEILDRNIEYWLAPQLALIDRAFSPRALQYDYANFAWYQNFLWKIDTYLPDGKSVLDFMLSRWDGWKINIAKDQRFDIDGMQYIIESLNPPWSLWLKQMAKNGNITPSTRVKWYTDVLINGKTIDVVQILIAFRANTKSFQSKESELNTIRQIATDPRKKDEYIPTVSQNFSEIAPDFVKSWQGNLEKLANELELMLQWKSKLSSDEYLRILGSSIASWVWINEQMSSGVYSWIDISGRILKPGERTREAIIWTAKFAAAILAWEVMLTKILAKIPWKSWWINGTDWIKKQVNGKNPKTQELIRAVL